MKFLTKSWLLQSEIHRIQIIDKAILKYCSPYIFCIQDPNLSLNQLSRYYKKLALQIYFVIWYVKFNLCKYRIILNPWPIKIRMCTFLSWIWKSYVNYISFLYWSILATYLILSIFCIVPKMLCSHNVMANKVYLLILHCLLLELQHVLGWHLKRNDSGWYAMALFYQKSISVMY